MYCSMLEVVLLCSKQTAEYYSVKDGLNAITLYRLIEFYMLISEKSWKNVGYNVFTWGTSS